MVGIIIQYNVSCVGGIARKAKGTPLKEENSVRDSSSVLICSADHKSIAQSWKYSRHYFSGVTSAGGCSGTLDDEEVVIAPGVSATGGDAALETSMLPLSTA